jgi:hypothetical protein
VCLQRWLARGKTKKSWASYPSLQKKKKIAKLLSDVNFTHIKLIDAKRIRIARFIFLARGRAVVSKLVVIAGPECSGKMPLARKLMAENADLVLVHRDFVRASLETGKSVG